MVLFLHICKFIAVYSTFLEDRFVYTLLCAAGIDGDGKNLEK